MKKTFNYPLFILALIGVLYVACSKEDSSEKFPPNTVATCADGLLNQGEFRVDCGGPCDTCALKPKMTAVIDSFWLPDTAKGSGAFAAHVMYAYRSLGSNHLEIYGVDTNLNASINFVHTQGLNRGVYFYDDIEGKVFDCELLDGLVEITAIDKKAGAVSGTFSFNCLGGSSGKKERVINGHFEDIDF
jgi:hypothetical protein